jgi:translation initiation factor 1
MKHRRSFRGVVLRHTTQSGPVARTAQQTVARTAPGQARVRVGREVAGRGGKGVSVISGLPLDEAQLAELATRLKRLCGAGGGVREGVIEIQGEHRDRLVAELCKLGYPARRSGG